MPTLTLVSKYKVDLTSVLSAEDIRANYLFGLDLSKNGKVITDEMLEYYIASSIEVIERELNVKLTKQVYEEGRDFFSDDWKAWGYMKASYPINLPISLIGSLGRIKQVEYPVDWLSTKKTSDGKMYSRLMYVVPNTGATHAMIYAGAMPYVTGYGNNPQIPNYWTMKYITGFEKVPLDILNAVGKLTTINVLMVAADFLQRIPGQSSQSISIDGLSQSTSTFANTQGGIFGSRVKQYSDELKDEMGKLRNYYNDVLMITA